jgi:tripartite-type tricarboxylate transporter receptor subunit TctC
MRKTALKHGLNAAMGLALAAIAGSASAQTPEQFYKGRQVDMFIGSEPSGGYDAYARIVGQFYARHIPGNPTMVYRNMPGASGLVMASSLYNKAPRDGSAIAILHNTIVIEPLMGRKVPFEPEKFSWIGSANQLTSICIVSDKSPVQTMKEAQSREVLIGASGSTSSSTYMVGAFLNTLADAKFKIIRGYPSVPSVMLAMERGEVDGLCGIGWDTVLTTAQQKLDEKTIRVLVQVNVEPIDDLKGIAAAVDLAKSPADREVMDFLISRQYIGRPFGAPPDIPKDRLAALRKAFDETMTDPAFVAEAKRLQLEANWIPGDKVQAHVAKMIATPKEIQDRANEASLLKDGVVQANLKWITVKETKLSADAKGGSVAFTDGGKPVSAALEGAKITVAGAEAKTSDLKAGLVCDVVYLGNKDAAQSVTCR